MKKIYSLKCQGFGSLIPKPLSSATAYIPLQFCDQELTRKISKSKQRMEISISEQFHTKNEEMIEKSTLLL